MMILEKAIQCLGYVGTYIYLSMLLLAFTDKVVFLLKPVFQLAQHVECQALACLSSNLLIHMILREESPFQSGTNTCSSSETLLPSVVSPVFWRSLKKMVIWSGML